MKFKVGDRVLMSDVGRREWNSEVFNYFFDRPGVIGVITRVCTSGYYVVHWRARDGSVYQSHPYWAPDHLDPTLGTALLQEDRDAEAG